MTETGSYPTVASAGEFGLIRRIVRRLGSATSGPQIETGPGDDAAVLRVGDARLVASVDSFVAGRDFRLDWSSGADIGAKAMAASLADVAAMGARPVAALVALGMPETIEVAWVDELTDGLREECVRAGAALAGGDVSGADQITLSVTVLGDADGLAPVLRSGARPGDRVVLAGRLGWSAAGLAALQAGRGDAPALADVIAAHRRPEVPYRAARMLAEAGATAMIDVSDGLLADLTHIAEASGVTVDLASASVPLDAPVRDAAALLGSEPLDWVLGGGEDHAIVACIPAGAAETTTGLHIGMVREGSGVLLDGTPVEPKGWRHF